jgi:hypothetical protein
MSLAALIRSMAAAGAPSEAIALAVEAIEAAGAKDAARRQKQAERKRRSRDSHGTVTGQGVTVTARSQDPFVPPAAPNDVTTLPTTVENNLNPTTPPISPPPPASIDGWPLDFREQFWSLFPNKVGKSAAISKLEAIRKRRDVPWQRLIGSLQRYAAKTDDRPWCNPQTWLNQGRWDDEPADPPPSNGRAPPGHPDLSLDNLRARLAERSARERATH